MWCEMEWLRKIGPIFNPVKCRAMADTVTGECLGTPKAWDFLMRIFAYIMHKSYKNNTVNEAMHPL